METSEKGKAMKKYKFYGYVDGVLQMDLATETTDDTTAAEFCRQTVNRLFVVKKTNEVLVECYSVETGEQVYGLKMVRA
jgi:hypothetical protein